MHTKEKTESRYNRQELTFVGKEGQRRISKAKVAVVGVGALGCVISDQLVRAGIGFIRLIDPDTPEISNIQRQILIDEEDVAKSRPKVEAAAIKLRRTNSEVAIDARRACLTADNASDLLTGVDFVLDGTDNFQSRYLINKTCLKLGTPWIFGGVLGAEGMCFPILPGGPCLECALGPEPPDGSVPTTVERGVLAPIVASIGSLEVVRAMRLICGEIVQRQLVVLNLEKESFRVIPIEQNPKCSACGA